MAGPRHATAIRIPTPAAVTSGRRRAPGRPGAGTASCPVHHVQVFLAGRFAVRMEDGEEVEFGPLDVGDISPGHDAWVVGDEPVHILDFAGNSDASPTTTGSFAPNWSGSAPPR